MYSADLQANSKSATAMRDISCPVLFEISWEVANKVGGIYTVIRTKAPVTAQEYGKSYFMIGPLFSNNASLEVEVTEPPPEHHTIRETIHSLKEKGIRIVFGRWLIDGYPYVLLVDLGSAYHQANEWKGDLWNVAGIPSPYNDNEMNDAIVFGYVVAWFLGEYAHRMRDRAIIAHFHEWMASVGLVLIQKRSIPIGTIFTTHATLLGRYLCAGDMDFYNGLRTVNLDEEAGRRSIYHRYCLERAAAHCSSVFTTVSHITAYEAEHLLRRKPDGVLPNGLNIIKFSAIHEFQNLHAKNKAKINAFVQGHFYGHYDFSLDTTLYFFTAGRYEYRNKGVDLYLEALARLNAKLKHVNSAITVVAFIIMPAATRSYTVDTLKGQAITKQLQDCVHDIESKIGNRIFESILQGSLPCEGKSKSGSCSLISEQDIVQLKRHLFALKQRDGLPPIVTHNMIHDATDPILAEIRRLGLFNAPSDRVKVVFHPEFLSSNNPVLGLDYEDFVRGCHLGVFPSYYEPWGYTPAECTVMGVPSITTNLSGFGCYMEENVENPSDYGIFIVDRRMRGVEESVQQLTEYMVQFCAQSRRQRINQRNRTERLSDLLDWKKVGLEYKKARYLALRRHYPDSFSVPMGMEQADQNGKIKDSAAMPGENQGQESTHSLSFIRPSLLVDQVSTVSVESGAGASEQWSGFQSDAETGEKLPRPKSAQSSPKMRSSFNVSSPELAMVQSEGEYGASFNAYRR